MSMIIVEYEEKYKDRLEVLLKQFSKEVWNTGTVNVEHFIDCHWAIYLLVTDEDIPVGFSTFNTTDYYGMRETIVSNDYMYIEPEYRNGLAIALIGSQSCRMAKNLDMKLQYYLSSEHSNRFVNRIKNGKIIYCTYEYDVSDVNDAAVAANKIVDRYQRRYNG